MLKLEIKNVILLLHVVNLGYFISEKDVIKLYHQSFIGEREFSGTTATPSKSKYEDENSRSMLEWVSTHQNYKSNFKVAYLKEYFEFYQNKNSEFYANFENKLGHSLC